jgi:hypothetical protein
MFNKLPKLSNYFIEDNGKIFSISKKDYISIYENNCGYNFVTLKTDDGKWKSFYVHRLVAEAFLNNSNNYPNVLHLDDNPKNNNVLNLKWGSQSQNMKMCVDHKRFSRNNKYLKNPIEWKLKDPNGKIHITKNLKEFCLNKNIDPAAMSKVINGTEGRKQHKGWTRA